MSDSKISVDQKKPDREVDAEKITTTVKKKDPKRVEAGKKLAAISKAAKEKKMRNMIEMEKSLNNSNSNNYRFFYVIIVIIAVVGITLKITSKNAAAGKNAVVVDKDPVNKKVTLENL